MACVIVKCVIHLYDLMKGLGGGGGGGGVIHWGGNKLSELIVT